MQKKKRKFNFEGYTNCLKNNAKILESRDRFKAETHIVFIVKSSKIALNSNYDMRLHTFDEITLYIHIAQILKI